MAKRGKGLEIRIDIKVMLLLKPHFLHQVSTCTGHVERMPHTLPDSSCSEQISSSKIIVSFETALIGVSSALVTDVEVRCPCCRRIVPSLGH